MRKITMSENRILSRIPSGLPPSQKNRMWFGKRRIDLPDDIMVYFHDGEYWTIDELHKHGALPQYRCLLCGELLLYEHYNADRPWMSNICDGDTWEVVCNYGSSFDTRKFIIGLCDKCISTSIANGRLAEMRSSITEVLEEHREYIDSCFEKGYKNHIEQENADAQG
jgi:hypothetical protein